VVIAARDQRPGLTGAASPSPCSEAANDRDCDDLVRSALGSSRSVCENWRENWRDDWRDDWREDWREDSCEDWRAD